MGVKIVVARGHDKGVPFVARDNSSNINLSICPSSLKLRRTFFALASEEWWAQQDSNLRPFA